MDEEEDERETERGRGERKNNSEPPLACELSTREFHAHLVRVFLNFFFILLKIYIYIFHIFYLSFFIVE